MHIRIVLTSLCIALPMLASGAKPVRFDAQLQSFNAAGVPVNSNAVGQAWVEIVDDGTAIYYQVEVAGIENAFMAHIHVSGVPVQLTDPAGPIVFWFFGGPPASPANAIGARINGSLARGYITADANLDTGTVSDLIDAIREGRATIVAHTLQNPAGEIRGTLQ
jgi:hypothetical protein